MNTAHDAVADRPDKPARFRKVLVRTWGDAKFRTLSPIPPCGQGLWLYLITGPHTSQIPGLFRSGRAAMAEALGWELEGFQEAFDEAFRQGMVKADFLARVMWVPKAIVHNRPESPNVVRSWTAEFDLIPECELKLAAWEGLRASVHALGEAFGKAFDESLPKPSGKPLVKAIAIQEQEQEQEQEKHQEREASSKPLSAAEAASSTAEPSTRQGRAASKHRPAAKTPTIPCPYERIYASYHELLPGLPQVRLTDDAARHRAMRKMWGWVLSTTRPDGTRRATNADEALQWLRDYWERASRNDFLMGRLQAQAGGKHAHWKADFDFLLTDRGMKHVIERTDPREAE